MSTPTQRPSLRGLGWLLALACLVGMTVIALTWQYGPPLLAVLLTIVLGIPIGVVGFLGIVALIIWIGG